MQPEGQGLLSDFEIYFKSLSETDKEVRLSCQDLACNPFISKFTQPFKKELRAAQAAAVSPYSVRTNQTDDLVTPEEAQNGHEEGHQHN